MASQKENREDVIRRILAGESVEDTPFSEQARRFLDMLLTAPVEDMRFVDPKTQIALVWDVMDVQSLAPTLSVEQARSVLQKVQREHNCEYGVTWDTIDCAIIDEFDTHLEATDTDM